MRNQGANIYHLHTDVIIQVFMCACKQHSVNTTKTNTRVSHRGNESPVQPRATAFAVCRLARLRDVLTQRATTGSIKACAAHKYTENEKVE